MEEIIKVLKRRKNGATCAELAEKLDKAHSTVDGQLRSLEKRGRVEKVKPAPGDMVGEMGYAGRPPSTWFFVE